MDADVRRSRALELHLAGASYAAIARALEVSKSTAHQWVRDGLEAGDRHSAGEAADTELARLDAMLTGLWGKARRGDLGAVDRVLRIEERRAQILARDAAKDPSDDDQPRKVTGLSDFERRLRERESAAKAARSSKSG